MEYPYFAEANQGKCKVPWNERPGNLEKIVNKYYPGQEEQFFPGGKGRFLAVKIIFRETSKTGLSFNFNGLSERRCWVSPPTQDRPNYGHRSRLGLSMGKPKLTTGRGIALSPVRGRRAR
ncbi:MAG: hypothetical protein IIA14_12270 [SAR324 cluster bacterium]|nr:hypothetical protein [SAR324 cluster bacterium]